jgi:uncharacterized membrane protein YdjX (TVP38/TMEM64 family)
VNFLGPRYDSIKLLGVASKKTLLFQVVYRSTSELLEMRSFAKEANALPSKPRSTWKRTLVVIGVALLIPIVPFIAVGELPGEAWLEASSQTSLRFAAVGALLLAADLALPIPSSLLGTLLGARLGFVAGTFAAFLGLMFGSAAGYLLGLAARRRAHNPALTKPPALAAVFLSRPIPVFAEAMTVTAGAEGMRALPFFVASSLGNILYALALAGNGAALLPAGLAGPALVLPMLLPAVSWLLWKRAKGKSSC